MSIRNGDFGHFAAWLAEQGRPVRVVAARVTDVVRSRRALPAHG
jgi:hypothetical protein